MLGELEEQQEGSQIRTDSGGKQVSHKAIINNFHWIVNVMRNRWKDLSKRCQDLIFKNYYFFKFVLERSLWPLVT